MNELTRAFDDGGSSDAS